MSNLNNKVQLIIFTIEKGQLSTKSLIPAFQCDQDFTENEFAWRDDTAELGFENEAERVSAEIFTMFLHVEEERERVEKMVAYLFDVDDFIGNNEQYGSYHYAITETESHYVVSIAVIV